MINETIKKYGITSHLALDKKLAELSGGRYYYSYDTEMKDGLKRVGLLAKCVKIEFDGIKRFYENEKV